MIFVDLSLLLALAHERHPDFTPSKTYLKGCTPKTHLTSARALIEIYAYMTGLPEPDRYSHADAVKFIQGLKEKLTIVDFKESYFLSLIENSDLAVDGDRTFEALTAKAAVDSGATTLVTWDTKHFNGLEKSLKITLPN
ncbi:MAG: hypothetical protein AAFV69_00235 [Pseudomonadota bacterium]